MQQIKGEYVIFSAKINNYLSKIMVEQKINYEEYHFSSILRLIKSEGVVIREYLFKEAMISGMLIQDPLETTIVVNQHLTSENKNFIISHELIHYLFHLNQEKAIFIDTMRDFLSYHSQLTEDFQANIGASAILIPDEVLIYFLKQGWNVEQISPRFGISIEHLHLRMIQMIDMYLEWPLATAKAMINKFQLKSKRTDFIQLGTDLENERTKKLVDLIYKDHFISS